MKGSNKKVCVILVNYNGLSDTLECIQSLCNSTVKADIIVVDNASEVDECRLINENYAVISLRSDKNLGFAGGNNLGLEYAVRNHYEYVILLNNDTVVADDLIEVLISRCDEGTVTTPTIYYEDGKSVWSAGGYINKFTGAARNIQTGYQYSKEPVYCSFASGCCICAKISTIKKVGFLDESFFMYCEDADYCIKLFNKGIRILYLPEAQLIHKVSKSTGGSNSSFCNYYLTRNRLRNIKQNTDYFCFTALPVILLEKIIRMIQFCINGKDWKSICDGIYDFIHNIYGRSDKY